jgi:predicted nucleotide-binding protein
VNQPKYHVYIEYEDPEKSGIRFNVSEEELVRTFVTPFTAGQPFWFMGRLLSPLKVAKYVIDYIGKGKVKGAYLCTEKFLTPTDKKSVASGLSSTAGASVNMRRIVVVHGSDEEMKQATIGALGKLGLAPVLMREQPSQGRKIVEKFADYADVSFAVVLLSPDDFAYAKDDPPTKRKLRPAQDVIFELGFFLGRLGKDNVLVFYREFENFEVPTDFEGVRFTAFDDRGSWKLSLIRELTACGYSVDANRLLK